MSFNVNVYFCFHNHKVIRDISQKKNVDDEMTEITITQQCDDDSYDVITLKFSDLNLKKKWNYLKTQIIAALTSTAIYNKNKKRSDNSLQKCLIM